MSSFDNHQNQSLTGNETTQTPSMTENDNQKQTLKGDTNSKPTQTITEEIKSEQVCHELAFF